MPKRRTVDTGSGNSRPTERSEPHSAKSVSELKNRIRRLEAAVRELETTNETLKAKEREFQLLADSVPAYFAYIDAAHRYRFVNKQHKRFFKVSGSTIIGKHVRDVLGAKTYAALRGYMERALAGEQVFFELEFEPPAVGPRWVEFTFYPDCYPDCDESGHCKGFYVLAVNITEKKRADLALRQERERAQKYLDLVGVIVVALDTEGRVALINRKGCEILGYKEQKILGKRWITNFVPEHLKNDIETYRKQLLAGEIESIDYYENPVLTGSGDLRFISWTNIILRDENGKMTGTLSAGSDVTEHIRTEERLEASMQELDKQRKALEEKNIALRELIGQVELEKTRMKEDITATVGDVIKPLLAKMRLKGASRKYVGLVERHLSDLASPYARRIGDSRLRLTPREIEICDLLKGGLSSKDVAELLGISSETVEKHRRHIRAKLGISKKDINLVTYLQSI